VCVCVCVCVFVCGVCVSTVGRENDVSVELRPDPHWGGQGLQNHVRSGFYSIHARAFKQSRKREAFQREGFVRKLLNAQKAFESFLKKVKTLKSKICQIDSEIR
jgi:hypothetical protein